MDSTESTDEQLKWFEPGSGAASMRRMPGMVPGRLMLRHDHAVLLTMCLLVTGSIVFALGVERGKRLMRLEQTAGLIARSGQVAVGSDEATSPRDAVAPELPDRQAPSDAKASTPPVKAPERTKTSTPSRVVQADGFAIQVVTYSQPKLAQRELQQLHQRGERAFLQQRSGKTALMIGPFDSRKNAAEKQAALRTKYQDCFIRTL